MKYKNEVNNINNKILKVLKPQRGGINIAKGNAPGTKIVFYAIGKCYKSG